ncbi:hypothetical protein RDI58_029115 [Solanum bulbocastanum]|uniref:Uncharacterized protein n=1 Tax=Solanum bulbocastanum TaxID=147425 RepID=A0AAN8XZM4_SOLBU
MHMELVEGRGIADFDTRLNRKIIMYHILKDKGVVGLVYKGKLQSGRDVAVKMLNKTKAGGQDFMNEVADPSCQCGRARGVLC